MLLFNDCICAHKFELIHKFKRVPSKYKPKAVDTAVPVVIESVQMKFSLNICRILLMRSAVHWNTVLYFMRWELINDHATFSAF